MEVAFRKSRLLGAEDLCGDGGGIPVFRRFRLTEDQALNQQGAHDPVESLGVEVRGHLSAFAEGAHQGFCLFGGQLDVCNFAYDLGCCDGYRED